MKFPAAAGLIEKAVSLQYRNKEFWQVTIHLPDNAPADAAVVYNYILRNAGGSTVQDGEASRLNPSRRLPINAVKEQPCARFSRFHWGTPFCHRHTR